MLSRIQRDHLNCFNGAKPRVYRLLHHINQIAMFDDVAKIGTICYQDDPAKIYAVFEGQDNFQVSSGMYR